MNLDRFDRAIVQALQLDGRISNSALAERVNLSESACLRRVRALEESGLIEGYTARINQQRAGEIKGALEAQRAKVLQMKALRDEGAVLVRDVENAQRMYDQIMQRLNQTTLESLATQSNVSVLSQAVPPVDASSPRLLFNMAVALFLGTLLAIAVVIALELLDRRVRSVEDVAQAVSLPIIGVLPSPNARRLFRKTVRANLMQQRLLGGRGPEAVGKGA